MKTVSKRFGIKFLGLSFCLLLVLFSTNAFARGGETAELAVSGAVLVNGVNVSATVPILKPSRIVTTSNSAVANLGTLGQVFIATGTEILIQPTAHGVQVELISGAVRVKGGSRGAAIVNSAAQARVKVNRGTVRLASQGNSDETLAAGESREFLNRIPLTSTASANTDFTITSGSSAVVGNQGKSKFTGPGSITVAAKPISRVNP